MKIKEVEIITGITKQNIRYYERQGLLNPERNRENDYREYSEEDVRNLKIIKLFRKLDMPIDEIRKLLHNEIELQNALDRQKEHLEREKERLSDALNFCGKIKEREIVSLNADRYLNEMEGEEQNGAVFADWINDFKKVMYAEMVREFSFMPDTMCRTPGEFTDALFRYADENHVNLVITKEGMYPEFEIDGVEYRADRSFSRFGAVVHCQMKYPDEIIPEGMSQKRYFRFQTLLNFGLVILLIGLFILFRVTKPKDLIYIIAFGLILGVVWYASYKHFYNLKN